MQSDTLLRPPPLAELAEAGAALFLDFDGTLIDIAPGPEAISVPADMADRLTALAARHGGRLALVSGRGLDNIAQHIGPLTIARAGSHGAERVTADGVELGEQPSALDPAIVSALQDIAARHDILLERKRFGAALHYRSNPDCGAQVAEAALELAQNAGLVAKHGKCVIELVPPGADKGGAVSAFMAIAPFAGGTPIFVGDDVTDEDGFMRSRELGGFGIAVGERISHNANFRLDSVADVYQWLNL